MSIRTRLQRGRWLLSALLFVAVARAPAETVPALAMQASSQATTSAGGSAVQSNAERGKVLHQNCTVANVEAGAGKFAEPLEEDTQERIEVHAQRGAIECDRFLPESLGKRQNGAPRIVVDR